MLLLLCGSHHINQHCACLGDGGGLGGGGGLQTSHEVSGEGIDKQLDAEMSMYSNTCLDGGGLGGGGLGGGGGLQAGQLHMKLRTSK